jgi:hypothetical protein
MPKSLNVTMPLPIDHRADGIGALFLLSAARVDA